MPPIVSSTVKKSLTLVTIHPVYALTREGYMRVHDERTLYRMTSPATGSIRIHSRDGTCRFWLQVTFARILWTFNGAGACSSGHPYLHCPPYYSLKDQAFGASPICETRVLDYDLAWLSDNRTIENRHVCRSMRNHCNLV